MGPGTRRLCAIFMLALATSGCAVYHDSPLPAGPELIAPPAKPLSVDEVERMALARSPDLAAARRKADVAEAQAYAAGLLPDPQFAASADHPTIHAPNLVNGYALGLSQDLQSLLTLPSRAAGAKAEQEQAKLDLLWAEWQTLQQAAQLYAQKFYADGKRAALQETAQILQAQAQHSGIALRQRNTTIDVAGSDLSAALDIASQANAAARGSVSADAALRALLGLKPDGSLDLVAPGDPAIISRQEVATGLAQVTKARPDLLALQAGYHAQDEAVRTAILQQFPAINLGFNRASDTSNIQSNGLAVTINIPIFGSTQANIRIARATRAQLRAEYQARLDQTTADAWRIWRNLALLHKQVDQLADAMPHLKEMADAGRKAYRAGNLAPATYVLLETTLSARQSELFDLRASLWDDTIALKTLLAMTPLLPQRTVAP